MIDPADTGGPRASDAQATIAATLAALADPAPGAAAATAWLERHVPGLDDQAPTRIKQALDALCSDGAGYRSWRGKGTVQRVAEMRCGAPDVAAS